MDSAWVWHNSHDLFFRNPFGAVAVGQKIELKLKVYSDEITSVLLNCRVDEGDEKAVPMDKITEDSGQNLYRVVIDTPPHPCLLWYYFIIFNGEKYYYYGNNPEGWGGVGSVSDVVPPPYQITVHKAGTKTPDWFKEGVIYQIFVDRFFNGSADGKVLNPKRQSLIHAHWDDLPLYIFDKETGDISRWNFFGGNLLGVRKKLSYLKSLGINTIYFNPIFEAPSNHKYDTGDYHKIDPMFGDNQLFKELCTEAREMGIAIILDGVFSHTGSDSIYFNKYGHYDSLGAYQSIDSPYYRWYKFNDCAEGYECWWNINTLPNISEMEPSYMDFVMFAENSVLKSWQSMGANGWRLDVADELPDDFIKGFYRTMKEVNPQSVLIGEVWEDASNKISYGRRRQYLLGEEMDSVMNYPFRNILLSFLTGQSNADAAHRALLSLYENYPRQHFYSTMNLVGSHDVPRALTILKENLPKGRDEAALARLKLLVLWQNTFPGVPCIYYGDEAGLEGGTDPQNRKTYPWGHENIDLLNWYRDLIAIRNHYDVLKTGQWEPLYAGDDVYGLVRFIRNKENAFGQKKKNNIAIVLLNRSIDKKRDISLDLSRWCNEKLVDALQDYAEVNLDNGHLQLTLAPLEGKLLLQDRWGANFQSIRGCGILLHPTSLPSKYGIGGLGQESYRFIDFMAESKQKLWQILPLNPPACGESPYQCFSAFAGNPLLIDPEQFVEEGLLTAQEVALTPEFDENKVMFNTVKEYKETLFQKAFQKFMASPRIPDYDIFLEKHRKWLDDYALFMALKIYFNGSPWHMWPELVRSREQATLESYRLRLGEQIEYHKFIQYKFFLQWQKVKDYANSKGIKIIGDIPIFVSHDSSDVWVAPELFELDEAGCSLKVAGVPPDYFCETGQCWGNPHYKWNEMEKNDYSWWRDRFEVLLQQVDIIRVDHFRGFVDYWEIPGSEKTAVNGRWVKGPGEKFFKTLQKYLGRLPVIAEDLGIITSEVNDLRIQFGYPGMKVMQFELEAGGFKVPLYEKNTVVYTGTHDNDTTIGWYKKKFLTDSGSLAVDLKALCWEYIEMAYRSDADTVILPLQDILCLDSTARMNTPGTIENNWSWRFSSNELTGETAGRLAYLVETYNR